MPGRSEGQETHAVPRCSHFVFMPHRSEDQETRAVPWCSCYVSVLTGQKAKRHVLSPGVHVMYLYSQVRRPRDTCCPLVFMLCICTHRSEGQETRAVPWCSHNVFIPPRSEGQETRAVPWWRGVRAWRAGWGGGAGVGSPVHRVLTRRPTTTAGSACSTRTVCPRSLTSRCRALRPPYTHCRGYPALPACLPPAVRQHIHLISDS